jgi:hypothetical protein
VGQADKKLIAAFICILSAGTSFGQYNIGFEESMALEFDYDGSLRQGTVGGFSNVQFSEIQLDSDPNMDLFVFDRGNDTWRTFIYNPSSSEYDYAPEFETIFPSDLNELALLRDYDCDGDQDIISYSNGGFRVDANNGQTPPEFNRITEAILSDYGSLITSAFILPGDVPAIIDVDGDGDLDILTFGNGDSENSLVWHQNRSMEEYGSCDSLEFLVVTECWGGFQEPANASELEAVACRPNPSPPIPWHQAARHHPGSSILLTDVTGDSLPDVIIGDIQTTSLVFAPNIGDIVSSEIDVDQQTTAFPSSSDPASMQYMVSAYEIDADHDNRMDLVVTTNNNIDSSCNTGHVWLYSNSETIGANYSLETKTFLLDEMLDLGTGTVPIVMDVDGDGLDDLILAIDFYRSPTSTSNSRMHYFRNTGTSTSPSFVHQDDDFADLVQYDFQAAYPTLGDIDNDGDKDMLIGTADGSLHYFQNTPSGGAANFSLVGPNYMGINSIGQNAAPEFADINGDNKLDLIVGERMGTLSYFQNDGTGSNPNFASTPTVENFGKIDVSFYCCNGNAAPLFVDNEAFGPDPYLFVGTSEKRINVYRIDSPTDSFHLVDSILILSDRIVPIISDFDNNGVYDLLVGTGEGGAKFFEREDNFPVGTATPLAAYSYRVYPNPTNESFTIESDNQGNVSVQIWNLMGSKVYSGSVTGRANFTTNNWTSGFYTITIGEGADMVSQKLIVIH